jgi:hypothetical protein
MKKFYNKIVINMATGEIIYEDSFYYDGPVILLKGGDGGGQSYDPVYNAGMMELSKEQQGWAREMFNQYKFGTTYNPEDIDPETGKTLGEIKGYDPSGTTSEMEYGQNLVEANQALLGQRTEVEGAQLSDTLTAIGERAPVRSKFFDEALGGIDIGKRMDESQADVEHGFKLSGESARREAMSYGVMDPNKIASMATGVNLEKAKAIAGARTSAKTTAEDEQFGRLRSAMNVI